MTRVGWIFFAIVVLAGAAFVSMIRIGDAPAPRPVEAVAPAREAALAVPVAGVSRRDLVDTWGDPRGGGERAHQGLDIAAPAGTPVIAAAAGRVEKLFESEAGGTTAYVRSDDGGWSYYYAHLAGYAPGLREGQTVRAGEAIGFVGDSGNAGAGNFHLHFGVSRMAPADGWADGEPVNPYPLLAGREPRG